MAEDNGSELFAIYARAQNGTIGGEGAMPWHIPADLRHFKALTMGKPMIMGRKTFDSFPSVLPGRRHIVLTHSQHWKADGVEVAHSPQEAMAMVGSGEGSVIGGAQIFSLFMPFCSRVELTEIHTDFAGDTHMSDLPAADWREVKREDHPAQQGCPAFSFVTLERRR
ncbi:MAG: dihydrofolate reductase [Sphingomonadaceae bacterium]